jgi:hypothetical protein
MSRCVNENCNNDPFDKPGFIPWGCDFDAACNQHCYDEARKQMDREFGGGYHEPSPVKSITKFEFIQ